MERVLVGMSGGVDSSVTAALLLQQGYEVIGATMLVWTPPGVDMAYSDSCCGLSAAEDARRVCSKLGIRHYTLDFKDVFFETIIRNYVDEYLAGHTPNPCIRCNEFVKFRALLDRARALGAERIATGHYARIVRDDVNGRMRLLRGVDRKKDQSYALYRLSQEQLAATLFPLGGVPKTEVRSLATELDLPTAGKPDSQETCFVPDNDYPNLLRILAPEAMRPGEVQDSSGARLGSHPGTAYYTIGQRRRLNVGSPLPLYVSRIDAGRGVITAVPGDHPDLFRTVVTASDVKWIGLTQDELRSGPRQVTAHVRYQHSGEAGLLELDESGAEPRLVVRFAQPVRGVAPGQALVAYSGEELLAGGVLAESSTASEALRYEESNSGSNRE